MEAEEEVGGVPRECKSILPEQTRPGRGEHSVYHTTDNAPLRIADRGAVSLHHERLGLQAPGLEEAQCLSTSLSTVYTGSGSSAAQQSDLRRCANILLTPRIVAVLP